MNMIMREIKEEWAAEEVLIMVGAIRPKKMLYRPAIQMASKDESLLPLKAFVYGWL